jgi:hypothetical protein
MRDLLLTALGGSAIWLVSHPAPHVRRWGFVAGLLSQVLWASFAWDAQSWGVGALVAVYTVAWARGVVRQTWRKVPP